MSLLPPRPQPSDVFASSLPWRVSAALVGLLTSSCLVCGCATTGEAGETLARKRGPSVAVRSAPARAACPSSRNAVVVDTNSHDLRLCLRGQATARYKVALGHGGMGKRREGDAKTPLGRYRLGLPRASVDGFHRFIPVGYPSAAQRSKGYTGGAVGIHGPNRSARFAGSAANTAADWTLGCVAVGSDGEIEAIEAWVRKHRVRDVVLR